LVTSVFSDFRSLYNFLARCDGKTPILEAIRDNPAEKSVIACIVQLHKHFREETESEKEDIQQAITNQFLKKANSRSVTFELDDGHLITTSVDLMCYLSPVMDAMLNGLFAEAGQSRVKFQNCSRKAMLLMVSPILARKIKYIFLSRRSNIGVVCEFYLFYLVLYIIV